MKKLKSIIFPVLLVIILGTQIFSYIDDGTINLGLFALFFAFVPDTIKIFKPNISENNSFKYFRWMMMALAIILIILKVKSI